VEQLSSLCSGRGGRRRDRIAMDGAQAGVGWGSPHCEDTLAAEKPRPSRAWTGHPREWGWELGRATPPAFTLFRVDGIPHQLLFALLDQACRARECASM